MMMMMPSMPSMPPMTTTAMTTMIVAMFLLAIQPNKKPSPPPAQHYDWTNCPMVEL